MRTCISKFIVCLIFSFLWLIKSSAQTCPPNIDFETGSFANWQCYSGTVTDYNNQNIINVTASAPINGRHTLITAATAPALDFYGKFPKLCPNGSGYSVRLGDSLTSARAERISYTFNVPAAQNDFSIIYHYAVVFEDPGHDPFEQPRFTSRVFDVAANQYINCASFSYISTANLPGFQTVIIGTNRRVRYKTWTPVSINLKGYAGKQIRLEFTTADCTLGAHFGYAYLDVGCSSIITGNQYCSGAPSINLAGPVGYQNYYWSTNNFTQPLGSSQTLTLAPPPPGNTLVALDIVPYAGFGCRDTIFTLIKEHPLPQANAGPDKIACRGTPVQIGSAGQPGVRYSWLPGNQSNPILTVSPATTTDYIITATYDSSGCKRSDTVKVQPIAVDTALRVTGNIGYCSGGSPNVQLQILSATQTIQWYKDGIAIPGATSTTYNALSDGVYYAVISDLTCTDSTRKINVKGHQPPGINFNINAGSQCFKGNFFQFTNSSTAVDSNYAYTWFFGDGGTGSTQNITHNYTAPGIYSVKLITTSSLGCKDTLTKPVTVFASPLAAFNISNSVQCQDNNSFSFINNSTVNPGSLTYQWTFGDGNNSSVDNPQHTYTGAGNFNATLIAISNNGCRDTIVKPVTIHPKPVVAFTINTSGQCNSSISLQNNSSSSSAIASFHWSFGDGNISTVANPTHTYSATGTYTIKLLVTTTNGCKDSILKPVTVYAKPIAGFAINNATQCLQANNFSFTNTSIASGAPLTYAWSFGDGGTSSSANPSHSFTNAGSYTVRLISMISSGCSDTSYQTITVGPKPFPAFAINDATQCFLNNNFSFTNTSSISTGTINYAWQFGDGGSSSLSNPNHNYSATGTYPVKLIVTSDLGCKDSIITNVTIAPQPVAAFSSASGQCQGTAFSFTNNSTISSGSLIYNWSFGNGNVSTSAHPVQSYSASGTYPVKLIVSSASGCTDSTSSLVIVYQNPTAQFLLNTNSQCLKNNSFSFTNNSTIGTGSLSHYWTFGDGNISTASNPNHAYSAGGVYQVKLVVTSVNGCKDSVTKQATVMPAPTVSFGMNSAGQCIDGNNFVFNNTSTISPGSLIYSWDFGDGVTSTVSSPSHSFASAGTYNVKLIATASAGCEDSLIIPAVVYPKPQSWFSFSNAGQCVNDNIFTFTNGSTVPSGSYTSLWHFGNGITSTANSPAYTYPNAGNYQVSLVITSDKGCKDTMKNTVVVAPKPTAGFNINNPSQCHNNSFSFTSTSTSTLGPVTVNWDFGDGNLSTNLNPVHSYTSPGIYNVRLVVLSANGCKDTLMRQVTVSPKPIPAFSVNQAGQCLSGNNFSFTNASSIPTGSLSYSWNFGDGGTSVSLNPSHAYTASGLYNIRLYVTSDKNCSDSMVSQITVHPKPNIVFAANNASQCFIGNNFSFNNTSGISSGSVNYLWSFGDGDVSTATNTTHSYTATGVYTVRLTGTSLEGCKDSSKAVIRVNPMPVSAFGINSSAQCFNSNSFSFVNASSIPDGTLSYNWNFGNGASSGNINPTYSYPTSGVFVVRLIATSGYGCIDSIKKSVTVHPKTTSSFSLPGNVQCFNNNSFSLQNTSVAQAGAIYLWTFSDGRTSTTTNPVLSFNAVGDYIVKLLVSVPTGCNDSATQKISVLASPKANFSAGNSSQCLENNLFRFTNSSTAVSGQLAHLWHFGDGGGSTVTNPTHSYASVGNYPVFLTTTAVNGCKDTLTKFVTVSQKPIGSLVYSANAICSGDTAILTATGGSTYKWYKDGILDAGITGPVFIVTQQGTYTVDVINSEGCMSKAISNVAVKVTEKPKADFVFDKYCIGLPVNFTNKSLSWNSPVSYLWLFPDSVKSTAINPSYLFNKTGTYQVKLSATSVSCKQLTDTIEKEVTIVPNEKGIRYNTVNAVMSVPHPLKAREIGISYKWFPSIFLNSSNIYNPFFNGTKEQQYIISITQQSGCIVVDTQLVNIHTNFDIFVPQAFSPNFDGNNDRMFPFLIGDGELIRFKIINRWGVVVFETNSERPGWDGIYKGVPQPVDGYVWEAEARDKRGNTIRKKGTLTLVR